MLVHTGQHYDREMSEIFLEELGVGEPDYLLSVGSGSHAQQTAARHGTARAGTARGGAGRRARPRRRELDAGRCADRGQAAASRSAMSRPACARFDRTMPEEINRLVADQLSQLLFIHSPEARDNLLAEGVARRRHPRRREHDDRLARRHAASGSKTRGAPRRTDCRAASTSSSPCTGPRSSTDRCSRRRSRQLAAISRDDARPLPGASADARRAGDAGRSTSPPRGCG